MHTALLLEMAGSGLADRIAVGSRASGLSFGTLLDRSRAAAAWLATQADAQTIVYVGLNSAAFPLALFAAGFAGKPFAPLNYRLPDADLRKILGRTAPSVAIVDDDIVARVTGVEGVTIVRRSEFEAHASVSPPEVEAAADAEGIAVLLFTSGTTGEPKAAVLRHKHLTSYVISTLEFMGAAAEEAALVSVPPYHIAAVSAVLTSTYLGRRVVHLQSFTPEEWVTTVRDEQVTHAMVVPTMLGRVLDVLESLGESLPNLRHLSYGGGPMPAATIERALQLLPHVDFVNAYGLTETSSTIAVLTPADHRAVLASEDPNVRRRLGSVGRPLPSIELSIRDPQGRIVAAGGEGEIWVRGEQVSGEYLNVHSNRQEGWFPTKDYGWQDADGFLFLGGRLDDVIVRGGENISPGEIEDVLRLHPAVRDVAVIGLPDQEWGERVAAVIVSDLRPDAEELRRWVKQRLRSTKTPQDIVFRDALPYNETGKLLRRALKLELAKAGGG